MGVSEGLIACALTEINPAGGRGVESFPFDQIEAGNGNPLAKLSLSAGRCVNSSAWIILGGSEVGTTEQPILQTRKWGFLSVNLHVCK